MKKISWHSIAFCLAILVNFNSFAFDGNATVGPRANLIEQGSTTDFSSDTGNCYTITHDGTGEPAPHFVPLKTAAEENINIGGAKPSEISIAPCSTTAGSGAGDCTCSYQCYSSWSGSGRSCDGSTVGSLQTGYTFRADSEQACVQVQSSCRTWSNFSNFPGGCGLGAVQMSSCGFVAD